MSQKMLSKNNLFVFHFLQKMRSSSIFQQLLNVFKNFSVRKHQTLKEKITVFKVIVHGMGNVHFVFHFYIVKK